MDHEAEQAERFDKIVAIAKEVLFQLDRKDYPLIPTRGSYLDVPVCDRDDSAFLEYETELQGLVEEYQRRGCRSCGIGSLLLAKARLFDNARVSMYMNYDAYDNLDMADEGYISRADTLEALGDVFKIEELNIIESFFEQSPFRNTSCNRNAADLGLQYSRATDALRAICENLIANGGRFSLTD